MARFRKRLKEQRTRYCVNFCRGRDGGEFKFHSASAGVKPACVLTFEDEMKVDKPAPKLKKRKRIETVTSLHGKLWPIFARYIKLRDCLRTTGTKTEGRCITCNKLFPIEALQAGHFITRRAMSIRYHEKNVHIQDGGCNGFKHGAPLQYQDALVKLYGEFTPALLRAREHSDYQWKAYELKALIEEYTAKVKKLEAQ